MTKSTPNFLSRTGKAATSDRPGTSARGGFDGYSLAPLTCTSGSATLSSFAVGDELVIAKIPPYGIVNSIIIHHAALGSSTTMQVGDASDDDRYITASSTSSTGVLQFGESYSTQFNFDISTVQSNGFQELLMKGAGATANGDVSWQVIFHTYYRGYQMP